MKVIFKTNLDAYDNSYFPDNLTDIPRIGEKVSVNRGIMAHLQNNKKLPTRLEVVNVTYFEGYVECELWYNDTDRRLAEASGAKTL